MLPLHITKMSNGIDITFAYNENVLMALMLPLHITKMSNGIDITFAYNENV